MHARLRGVLSRIIVSSRVAAFPRMAIRPCAPGYYGLTRGVLRNYSDRQSETTVEVPSSPELPEIVTTLRQQYQPFVDRLESIFSQLEQEKRKKLQEEQRKLQESGANDTASAKKAVSRIIYTVDERTEVVRSVVLVLEELLKLESQKEWEVEDEEHKQQESIEESQDDAEEESVNQFDELLADPLGLRPLLLRTLEWCILIESATDRTLPEPETIDEKPNEETETESPNVESEADAEPKPKPKLLAPSEAARWASKIYQLTKRLSSYNIVKLDTEICNGVLNVYAEAQDNKASLPVLVDMKEMVIPADLTTYNTLIKLAARMGDRPRTLRLVEMMRNAGFEPDVETEGHLLRYL